MGADHGSEVNDCTGMGEGMGPGDIDQGWCPECVYVRRVEGRIVAAIVDAEAILAEAQLFERHRVEFEIGHQGTGMTT